MNNVVSSEKNTSENWLVELNELLESAELAAIKNAKNALKYPICLVIGSPGSGTTLLTKFLADSGVFAYPSNFISKFYNAPFIGAKIQKMITDTPANSEVRYLSHNNSKSTNYLNYQELFNPNSFFDFWLRFFPFKDYHKLTADELEKINFQVIKKELSSIEQVFNKPMLINISPMVYHLTDLLQIFENFFIVEIKRDTFYSIQSILNSRKLYLKNMDEWFSVKPPEYSKLYNLNSYKQAAAQLFYVRKEIEKQLSKVSSSNIISIDYRELCNKPGHIWKNINDRYNSFGFTLHNSYDVPKSFQNNNKLILNTKDKERILAAYFSMFGTDISPKS